MAIEALAQVRDSLDALVKGDAALAREVIAGDRGIDRHQRGVPRASRTRSAATPTGSTPGSA